MDPVTLATVTSAVVNLALEAAKEVAPQAAKDGWAQIKKRLGWNQDPAPSDLAPAVATTLAKDPAKAMDVTALLQERPTTVAGTLVGSIKAGKVVVAERVGTINM